jgi:chromate transporter
MEEKATSPARSPLLELALLFLRLGTTSFGGPAAHIAMMEDEVVRRRGWLTREELLDMIGAANLIPGPNSTELAIHIGHRRAGWRGLLVAGVSFILPAALITSAIAWAYVRFGTLPQARWILYGVKPVIIAVVVQALWALGRTAVKTWLLGALGALAITASLAGIEELVILAAAGVLVAVLGRKRSDPRKADAGADEALFAPMMRDGLATAAGTGALASATSVSLGGLFLAFAKIGSVLFGSGYVLLAFMRSDLVEQRHWLTEEQLLDAIAVGQITPGPVFTTATFVGWIIRGGPGAAAATLGIFLPAFCFVAISGPLVPRIRRSPTFGAFLDGVNVGSLGLMAAVSLQLGRTALVDVPAVVLAVVSGVLLVRFKVSSAWLVLGGASAGALLHLLR